MSGRPASAPISGRRGPLRRAFPRGRHSLDRAHRRRSERADCICEERRALERPACETSAQKAGHEGVACSGAVDGGYRERFQRSLDALPRRVAARVAALEHDLPDAPLPEPRRNRRGLLLPVRWTALGQAGGKDQRAGGPGGLDASARSRPTPCRDSSRARVTCLREQARSRLAVELLHDEGAGEMEASAREEERAVELVGPETRAAPVRCRNVRSPEEST